MLISQIPSTEHTRFLVEIYLGAAEMKRIINVIKKRN